MRKPIPFGKYYLLERINVGGMAEVFRAKAYGVEGFERLVAVKRILPNIAEDKDFIRMFIDEAKIAVQLNHANIAQIFDLGMVETDYYIALEHVHGRDLRAIFDRCRQRTGAKGETGDPMPIAQACFVIMKVCEGLDYAHNKRDQTGRELNLVHRDVSPQNVLVSFEGEVKVIDFGIAKAAGKGTKTQAGILKGKFGYMSPEQVRGLPIDRRSDVFSCGIVLYELLTGERLFVGESDFSTLEKVRNVEILPPSTYNRRIPEELERIVLKALAKDAEERYQNAIDLHDELQAFVYTAGEFYSRKDLAGWMKTTFAAEIEAESAKLESFRHMSPPEQRNTFRHKAPETQQPAAEQPAARPQPVVPVVPAPAQRRPTLSMPAAVPPPAASTRPARPNGRRSGPLSAQMQAVVPPPSAPVVKKPVMPAVGAQAPVEWDEDEQETSIYTDKEEALAGRKSGPRPVAAPAAAALAAAPSVPAPVEAPPPMMAAISASPAPELGDATDVIERLEPVDEDEPLSPSATARSWPPPIDAATKARNGSHGANPFAAAAAPAPATPAPVRRVVHEAPTLDTKRPSFAAPAVEPSAVVDLAALAPPMPKRAQPMPLQDSAEVPLAFGNSFLNAHRHGRPLGLLRFFRDMRPSTIAQIAVTALVGVVIVVLIYVVTSGDSRGKRTASAPPAAVAGGKATAPAAPATPAPAAAATPAPAAAPTAAVVPVDPASGFDLIVDPAGVKVKLDGRSIGKAPLQIRNLIEGNHLVELEAPPGFFGKSHTVQVVRGQAQRVVLKLDAMQVTGKLTSEPPGAKVTLVVDGEKRALGVTPLDVSLDPRKRYEAVFRREGYAPASRPIAMTGTEQVAVAVVLERAGGKAAGGEARAAPRRARAAKPVTPPPMTVEPDAPVGEGTLGLMSKPPCRIFIDGRDTGMKTPQAEIKLPAGRHRVTLINDEFGLKESFVVEIQPGETMKAIKDLTSQLPAAPAE